MGRPFLYHFEPKCSITMSSTSQEKTKRQRAAKVSEDTRASFEKIACLSNTIPEGVLYNHPPPLLPLSFEVGYSFMKSALIYGDPFDIARDWQNYSFRAPIGTVAAGDKAPPIIEGARTNRILVLDTTNLKTPGGRWEQGILNDGEEESMARRSNLVATLERRIGDRDFYPLHLQEGVYSPSVVIVKLGLENDWSDLPESQWTCVSVVSVALPRNPKIDVTGKEYAFSEEKIVQKNQMKTILRIAALHGHRNLVPSSFGCRGPQKVKPTTTNYYKHPIEAVAKLWRELFDSDEFKDDEIKHGFKDELYKQRFG
ncbi:Similar to hypothetical protein [Tuber melanosporum Mel28]; acc. no. XP_002838244 [Pyronema omphalodes CBS 100304]|uniref:Microbial-type PARG catalytic domain-containing protein n=1 Tax=Pyronema omphalodes (strain CBS 100304) TaxID=1076935 RepID=U4KXJ9_PYROM|nr:Similar to hypothetical protein [Tuber melanosporum Mel28]; acc. no. XP_002838244 [Pyronema omphalodes CBS 100304]